MFPNTVTKDEAQAAARQLAKLHATLYCGTKSQTLGSSVHRLILSATLRETTYTETTSSVEHALDSFGFHATSGWWTPGKPVLP